MKSRMLMKMKAKMDENHDDKMKMMIMMRKMMMIRMQGR